MLTCQHHFLTRNKLSFPENWKNREFGCEDIQVASHDSILACVLFSSPCAMKLEKRMLSPNLHRISYDVLPAPGRYPVLMHLCVRTEWLPFWHVSWLFHFEGMLAFYSPTHSLPITRRWEIGLITGVFFLLLSPLSSTHRELNLK